MELHWNVLNNGIYSIESNRQLHFDNLSNPTKLRFSNASRTSDISSNSITFEDLSSPYIGKENYETQVCLIVLSISWKV